MAVELLSYTHSILNPLIKLVILVLFAVAVYFYYLCRARYGGKLRLIATLLLLGGLAGILASAFRSAGDFYIMEKWGESVFSLLLAIITLLIACFIRIKFKRARSLFVPGPGGDQK